MKKIILLFCTVVFSLYANAQKNIAVIFANVTLSGNLPDNLRNNPEAQTNFKLQLAKQHQAHVANALVRQANRPKNRKLNVSIITPQDKGYDAKYVVAPQLQFHMIMSARTANRINMAANAINFNTPYNVPYARANSAHYDFVVYKAGTNQIVWNKPGHTNAKARKLFRYMRRNNL